MSVRRIAITTVLNGFVVEVGCQTVVIQGGPAELCQHLHEYLSATPSEAERIEQSWLSTPLAMRVYGGGLAEAAPGRDTGGPAAEYRDPMNRPPFPGGGYPGVGSMAGQVADAASRRRI